MKSNFVISLDFELMWGVRDHRNRRDYGDAILGGRAAIPEILKRFEAAGIRATWATVGLLFARSRAEMLAHAPKRRPAYEDYALSPYPSLENGEVGETEAEDPFHFGASLIDRIAQTSGQEISSHTYGHFYCLEPGADIPSFKADLDAAHTISSQSGYQLKSVVFPRNQNAAEHIAAATQNGLGIFRGPANGWLYRPRSTQDTTNVFRACRFADGAFPISAPQVVHPNQKGPATDVPASRFLRPWSPRWRLYHRLHLRRISLEIEKAARTGGTYHLWWHPHNFGRHTAQNLAGLDVILDTFRKCRDRYGMVSKNMMDFSDVVPR